ncbi:hypothetical protein Pst134EB_029769 [Puccinia striiformis f. sp. tritici]|uniref:Uncharacterized protein n=1 Tax=Puccinia striiformis f. sp. tritici PST-78 TaxID=1165861 RepID=A0A0L0UU90_9BASI|nr:hypothetical protein Pst134EB_029769 [Puccinia striiformis f. sp. tritici]KNE90491.1 hypothetical protein PSTG_16055 [Puccinia striiformis f. sp. tritici PST-78]
MADSGNTLSGLIDTFSFILGGEDNPQAQHYEQLGRVHNAYVVFWDRIHNRPDPLELISQVDIRKELWDQLQSKRLPSLRRQINSLANALASPSSDYQNKPVSKLKLVLKILAKLDTILGKIKFAIACISPDIEPIRVRIDQDFKKLKSFICCRLQSKIYRVNQLVCELLQSTGRFYQKSGHELDRHTKERTSILGIRTVCIEAIDEALEYMNKSELRIVQDEWQVNIESLNQSLEKFTLFSSRAIQRNQEIKREFIRQQIASMPQIFYQTEEYYLQNLDDDHSQTTSNATRSMISAIKLSRLLMSKLIQISKDKENFKMREDLSSRELDLYMTMSMMLSEGIKVVVYGLTEKDNELHINDPSAITQAIDHLIATPELTITRTSHVFQSISDLPFPKIFRKAWFYHWNQLHILATRPFSHGLNQSSQST